MKPTLRSGLTELTNDGSTLATNNQLNAKFERSNLAPVDDSGRQFSATAETAGGRCNRLHEAIAMSRSELLLFATEPARAGESSQPSPTSRSWRGPHFFEPERLRLREVLHEGGNARVYRIQKDSWVNANRKHDDRHR